MHVAVFLPVYQPFDPALYRRAQHIQPLPPGLVYPQCEASLIRTFRMGAERGVRFSVIKIVGESALDRAEGVLLALYLETYKEGRYTHTWRVDSDQEWDPAGFFRMLDRDLPIVGALVPKKTPEVREAGRRRDNAYLRDDGLLPMRYLAGGFILTKHALLERMIRKFGSELGYLTNPEQLDGTAYAGRQLKTYGFWVSLRVRQPLWHKQHPGAHELLSDDYSYCEWARKAGAQIYADATVQVRHWTRDRVYELPVEVAA